MTAAGQPDNKTQRVGLFGLLGLGNSGNEASVEAMLNYLKSSHPGVTVDAMSAGAERFGASFGIRAVPLSYFEKYQQQDTGLAKNFRRLLGKAIDPLRIILWVRRHDLIIVPGMGVLEATTPLRAYGFPLSMFMVSAAGKICNVKVALVSVGASPIKRRATRLLLNGAARLAFYCSYRDAHSIAAMRARGVDTSKNHVFPDLAFSFPAPAYSLGDPGLVGIGVMDYHGGNDDRVRADELHSAYLDKMTRFVKWLLDNDFRVRLFGGDDSCDNVVAQKILANVAQDAEVPGVPGRVTLIAPSRYADMLAELNDMGSVVAMRYHNVLGAVLLGKPTIAIGYAQKLVALMEAMGVGEFSQLAQDLDVDRLIEQFTELQARRAELGAEITKRKAALAESVSKQFDLLSATLFSPR